MNQLRREKIGKYIQEKGAVTVKELSALFPDVSLSLIHISSGDPAPGAFHTKIL